MYRALPLLALLAGCATMSSGRPSTVFPPLPDQDSGAVAIHDQGMVTVLEHQVSVHNGCYAVQRPNGGGIIRCGVGQLEWVVAQSVAEGVDDFDNLKDAMKYDAEREQGQFEDKEFSCTVGGAPASCRAYGFQPRDGSPARTTVIGLAQLPGKALVAQCVAKAGGTDAMKPVCAEIFEAKQ